MKKITAFILLALFPFAAFAACGRGGGEGGEIVVINSFGDYDEARRVMYQSFVGDVDLVN